MRRTSMIGARIPSRATPVLQGIYTHPRTSYVEEGDMSGAQLLIDSFWADVGLDNHDYQPGQILEPSKKWLSEFA